MSTLVHASIGPAEKLAAPGLPTRRYVKEIAARLSAWATAYANALATAAIYESLSKLSDAELRRRGLSRSTLAHDVSRIVERGDGWPEATS